MKSQLAQREEQIAGMEKVIAEKEKGHQKAYEDAAVKDLHQKRIIKGMVAAVIVLILVLVLVLLFK